MKTSKNLTMVSRLAWRNIWKNKRRTILTLLLILFGTGTIILMRSFQYGSYSQMIYDAVSSSPGHIQIQDKAHWDKQVTSKAFLIDEKILERLKVNEKIKSFGRRIYSSGAVWKGSEDVVEDFNGVIIQAIEPGAEKKITVISEKVAPGGRYFRESDTNHILIGERLAKKMKVKVGDELAMQAMGYQSNAAGRYSVIGIFRTGSPIYDQGVLMPFKYGMEIFGMQKHINAIVIKLYDPDDVIVIKDYLKEDIKRIEKINQDEIAALSKDDLLLLDQEDIESLGNNGKKKSDDGKIEVLGWDRLVPEMMQMIALDRISSHIFVLVLYLVVAFGIVNTIHMSIFERIREFGVMLAIGTRPLQITSMVIFETAYITVMGIILGIIVGGCFSVYFNFNPLDFSEYAKEMEMWGVATTQVGALLKFENVIRTSIITFCVAVFFAAYPAYKASLIRPVEAIRHL